MYNMAGINFMYLYALQYDSGRIRKDLSVRLIKNVYNSKWPMIRRLIQAGVMNDNETRGGKNKPLRRSTRTRKNTRKVHVKDVRRSRG